LFAGILYKKYKYDENDFSFVEMETDYRIQGKSAVYYLLNDTTLPALPYKGCISNCRTSSLRGGTTKQSILRTFWFASGKALAMTEVRQFEMHPI